MTDQQYKQKFKEIKKAEKLTYKDLSRFLDDKPADSIQCQINHKKQSFPMWAKVFVKMYDLGNLQLKSIKDA